MVVSGSSDANDGKSQKGKNRNSTNPYTKSTYRYLKSRRKEGIYCPYFEVILSKDMNLHGFPSEDPRHI